jgi:hypothetical protein
MWLVGIFAIMKHKIPVVEGLRSLIYTSGLLMEIG